MSQIESPENDVPQASPIEIIVDDIVPDEKDKHHFRVLINQETVDAIEQSIEKGRLYQPIIVTELKNDPDEGVKYKIVDGEHRLQAHKQAGKSKIMALVIPETEALLWGIKANILRSDYNAMEKSNALQKLREIREKEASESENPEKYLQRTLAIEVGLSEGMISDYLKLQNLPDEIRKLAEKDKNTSVKTLRSMVRKKSYPDNIVDIYQEKAGIAERAADGKKRRPSNDFTISKKIDLQKSAIKIIANAISKIEDRIKRDIDEDKLVSTELTGPIKDLNSELKELTNKIGSLQKTLLNKT